MTKIIDRTGKGTALSAADNDANASSLAGINEAQTVSPYTVTIDDQNRTIEISSVGAFTANLTAIATIAAALHTDDFQVTLKNIGAGAVTVNRGSTDVFDDASTSITLVTGDTITLQTDSTLARWNVLSPSKILGITNGTVKASGAVVVNASKDALGFGKITGSTASGYTASFTYTGTTNYDCALFANVTMAAGITYAFSIESQSTTNGAAGVYSIAYGATGVVSSGYFESRSNAGIAVKAVATIAGGIPIQAVSFDAADNNATLEAHKGGRQLRLNPRSAVDGYNPIVVAGDQTIISLGPAGAIDTSVLFIGPHATDEIGILMSAVTDNVTIRGTTITLTGAMNGTGTVDEDTMVSNSDTRLPTQQSVKAYVDNKRVILDTPEVLVGGSAVNGSWQTHSSATLATANAKTAILRYMIEPNNTAGNCVAFAYVRKTGSALSNSSATRVAYARTFATGASATGSGAVSQCEVNLDVNNDFDWYTQLFTGTSTLTDVVLVGYYI